MALLLLIGFEVIEQTGSGCIIKSISTNESQEFNNVLRRIFLVSRAMAKGTLETLQSGEVNKIEDTLVLEQTNNRLTNFCHRIINKSIDSNTKTTFNYNIIGLLESICDDYKYMLLYMKKKGSLKLNNELFKTFEDVNALFDQYYKLFYKYTDIDMDQFRIDHKKISVDVMNNIHKKYAQNEDELIIAIYLHNVLQRIYDAIGATTGLHY